jgi:hypothetical protein
MDCGDNTCDKPLIHWIWYEIQGTEYSRTDMILSDSLVHAFDVVLGGVSISTESISCPRSRAVITATSNQVVTQAKFLFCTSLVLHEFLNVLFMIWKTA